ncbi:radical SAM family heme chaperone HemW [Aestuariimicrobium ganziense]|uniref:radical SAM family heme chaperone HemW n=1 Tax=Aestuariimicrobium ganziense TaxID=2773677 RepID=UPI001942AD51|nr:radical SAM family heme chaperone HemW [Aestuariimicrobium ganziense]
MAGAQPDGEAVPDDGSLPLAALDGVGSVALSAYLHVPFCTSRCGYCDFNTYTPSELGGLTIDDHLVATHREIDLAARVLGDEALTLSTVFVGGGTPSLLTAAQFGELLDHLRSSFGLAGDAEVTTEANPESTTPALLDGLLEVGVNRLSLGMQSARPHVLAVLDRKHTPGRALEVVDQARTAGFDDISLDLIMGTPGESIDDWRASLDQALSVEPDHLSCYSLIVEEGTRLAARIRRGEVVWPSDDDHADKYLLTEQVLTDAGFVNYEVSNWARPRDGHPHRSRHNLAYWQGHHWWGFGPGAHSHVGGVRWWNHKHPRRYGAALAEGRTPGAGREVLDDEQRRVERVLLELRLADGLPLSVLTETERERVGDPADRGLAVVSDDRLVLTLRGRLLADAVIRDLLD